MARQLEILLDGGRFFEAPRWHDGRWYVSDFHRHVVQTVDEHGSPLVILEVPEQPSGLGWLPDGSLLVVSMKDARFHELDPVRVYFANDRAIWERAEAIR